MEPYGSNFVGGNFIGLINKNVKKIVLIRKISRFLDFKKQIRTKVVRNRIRDFRL